MPELFHFDELEEAPLIIDAIYEGGKSNNIKDEVLSKLLPKTSNSGGFRKTLVDGSKEDYAYITLFTTMSEKEWPDYMDNYTGIFKYYGDNRKPGHELHDTARSGNKTLKELFSWLNNPALLYKIPPILVFKKEKGRNVKFLGLAVPGYKGYSEDQELVAFWRTIDSQRFQNYEAYFTILDTGKQPISKEWLKARIKGDPNSNLLAPKAWINFLNKGRIGIKPLKAPEIRKYPPKKNQLPPKSDVDGNIVLNSIRTRYSKFKQGFEHCAVKIVQMIDANFVQFDVTRPWRDGGRDATGYYRIGSENSNIMVECSLEAKLYNTEHGVNVREMSRLISRLRYRQFGIMVTTSYVSEQAYKEVKEDGHPIIMITGKDIVEILRSKHITASNIEEWLDTIPEEMTIDELI